MYQPCHRCDRIRLAISVPSPLQIPLSVGILHDWPIRHLLSLLEFDLPPPNLDFDLLLSSEQVHAVVTVLHPPLALAAATFQCSQTVVSLCYVVIDYPFANPSGQIVNPKKNSLLGAIPPHATSIERYPKICRTTLLAMPSCYSQALWVRISPGGISAPAILSGIKGILSSLSSFPPHQLSTTASYIHFTSKLFHYPSTIHSPFSCPTMLSIFNNCDTNDFYCKGRSDPSIDIGVCYYPDRDQWSPIFNPCVVPDDNADGNNSPIDPVDNQGPVDVKPIVEAKEKGPAEANVDPALINTILACSASLVYIPKGMEIVETRTHYFPLKDKWHTINDPSRHYDCTRYQSLACFPSLIHSSVSRGTSTTPSFLLDSPSETSSKNSDASSTYPLISNYINLNHQGVQKLLLDDNTPPTAV
ncbi:hypothetical protein PGTUg99_019109 [Puccinia graminis f. sp. tritici]|uniref:Uncharacterized protein n=1 Tax=Puccinia graminis f. sp. tritici TaxID=56615 RepID=A0A5B0SIC9_PUCGR|nr:hypothetical protein PGTUg99_019109 [Puccinia graminis f. sp. tritici]